MIGPAMDSMSERMLGFRMAASQVVKKMNTAMALFSFLSLTREPSRSTMERTMPAAPSAAPR